MKLNSLSVELRTGLIWLGQGGYFIRCAWLICVDCVSDTNNLESHRGALTTTSNGTSLSMTVLVVVLILLSVGSSLVVLLGVATSILRASLRDVARSSIASRWHAFDVWERLHLVLCLLDALLLLAVTPVFVRYAHSASGDAIGHRALSSAATVFATASVMVLRPAILGALAAGFRCTRSAWRVLIAVTTMALVVALSTIASLVGCSSVTRTSSTCANIHEIKIIMVTSQIVFASLATAGLIILARSSTNNKILTPVRSYRTSIVAARAPSLSLLIHTQPEAWIRHIELDMRTHLTDFGPSREHEASIDYGPEMVHRLLGETAGSRRTADQVAPGSQGYASAAASSANPYRVGSTCSITSRDAFNGLGLGASRVDLAQSADAKSTSGSLASRVVFDDTRRSASAMSRSATQDVLLQKRSDDGQDGRVGGQRGAPEWFSQLPAGLASLWIPIALLSAALWMHIGMQQNFVLLASFCLPAAIALLREIALGCSKTRHNPEHCDVTRAQVAEINNAAASTRTSTSSSSASAVMVIDTPQCIRNRRSHLRSHSCPLESELNGYGHLDLDTGARSSSSAFAFAFAAKHRQSISSARSVPYLSKHWTAGRVSGDRVVAPRSSFVRGLNLMLNPKPKLEVLPNGLQHRSGRLNARTGRAIKSNFRTAVSESAGELLHLPHVEGQETCDSEQTCFTSQDAVQEAQTASLTTWLCTLERDGRSDGPSFASRASADAPLTGVILDMDDTPGSARLRPDEEALYDHAELASPTKRQLAASDSTHTCIQVSPECTPSRGFSCSHDSHSMRTSHSASRLFSEIMDMVRGNARTDTCNNQAGGALSASANQSSKGYESIAAHHVRGLDSANSRDQTIIIHSNETSEFCTATSQLGSRTCLSSHRSATVDATDALADPDDSMAHSAQTDLVRNASTSSTLSLSSISSRIRSLRRTSSVASCTGESPQVKKMRSRTFASAFGIELSMLRKRDAVDSSPSTSSGTCRSLMEYSFTASPSACETSRRGLVDQASGTSPSVMLDGTNKTHRRNASRADSIMDMSDAECGDTIEEMLEDPVDSYSCISNTSTGAPDADQASPLHPLSAHDSLLDEVDLADVTVNEIWDRSHSSDLHSEAPLSRDHMYEAVDLEDAQLMGFDTRRIVARAPFLDTVLEEEAEGELTVEHVESRTSRETLLQQREAEEQRVKKLLLEHEVLFPHKTLSRIDEVTEVATTLRASSFRANSGASSSKSNRESAESTVDEERVHLGLPISLGCRAQEEEAVGSWCGDVTRSTDSIDDGVDERAQAQQGGRVEEKPLPFVTPRSTNRRRVAAQRRASHDTSAAAATNRMTTRSFFSSSASQPPSELQASPESAMRRLGELGLNEGIWSSSPLHLSLDAPGNTSQSFELVSPRSTQRSMLNAARAKLNTDKLLRLDHADSPKREARDRLADIASSSPVGKRLLHKPVKKRRKSRIKRVAVMVARHQFTVVDEDDSLVQRASTRASQSRA